MLDTFDNARQEWFDVAADDAVPGRRRGILRCASCAALLTFARAAVAVGGKLRHVATNPAGITFRFATFASAPGCVVNARAQAAHSWFPPARWQCAHCGGCGTHCGWRFAVPDGASFHALIEDRLVEDDDA
ncbi:MAG: cereblon family protein [Gammaproteobacteria bacterium]